MFGVLVLLIVGLAVSKVHADPDDQYDTPPASYHVSSQVQLTPVRDTGNCLVSAVFALNTALEIAHYKTTGRLVQFSEQEYIDCTWSGCAARGVAYYISWLQVLDRLSAAHQYTGYAGKPHTCRAGASPNALTAFSVVGYTEVEVEEVESEIYQKGSVLACVDTDEVACPQYQDYSGGVIDTDDKTNLTCRRFVTIVGYTPDYYIVRDSHGDEWGEDGYFRISRGNDVCGIESTMYTLETEEREGYWNEIEAFADEGCPLTYPIFCNETRTCMEPGQECIRASDEAYDRNHNVRRISKRDSPEHSGHSPCEDQAGYPCAGHLKDFCHYDLVRSKCGATCEVPCPDDIPDSCYDKNTERCADKKIQSFCDRAPSVRAMCPETCDVPIDECGKQIDFVTERKIEEGYPSYGHCYRPHIPNGRVLNRALIRSGDKLEIMCREGYQLLGDDTYCEIQNVFRPDTRRLPECVKMGGEEFTGSGADYTGRRNVTHNGDECGNWLEMLYTGRFLTAEAGEEMKGHGNHNYCRSGPGDWSPFCMSEKVAGKSYCFPTPGCGGGEEDVCSSVRSNDRRYEELCTEVGKVGCEAPHEGYRNRAKYYFTYCAGTCCAHAGCQ